MMTMMEANTAPVAEAGPAEALAAAALTLARRFAAGGTMWCVAPEWPSHGRHIAVEFIHPVIIGKRALPAMSIDSGGGAAALRLLVRRGDVLVVVSTAGNAAATDLLDRAEAWGLTRVWLGTGPRPAARRAEHVVWLEGSDPALAARSGDMVLLYHLLWELTHVVFEHPGLLEAPPGCAGEVCITCSDEGRVAEVRSLLEGGAVEVTIEGVVETVDATLVAPVAPGDLLLVHAGVALTTIGASP
ncbi:MAG TPA: HypC/HybG/HupF family hydrogenase formation chaperone [Acidimicrobiales bacterium]|nr:HypC/HybG/HupF family hydrogenase formation chaperone [Acidimicrobiales bacterium]